MTSVHFQKTLPVVEGRAAVALGEELEESLGTLAEISHSQAGRRTLNRLQPQGCFGVAGQFLYSVV